MRKTFLTLATAIFLTSSLVATSQAAGVVAGGTCTKAGAITVSGTKTFICSKALSGKLVWTVPSVGSGGSGGIGTGAKPQISGGGREGGGPDDEGSAADIARHAAMKKYSDCLVAHGGTAMDLGRPGPGGPNGTRPSQSPAQTKAMAACASLAPKFPKSGGQFRGPNPGGDDN